MGLNYFYHEIRGDESWNLIIKQWMF